MATRKEIMKYLNLSVNVETEPNEEVQKHIKQTILGTPGKIRYQHTSFAEKLPFLGKIFFMNLLKSGKLMGTVAFSLRDTSNRNGSIRSWYIRYFSIRAPLRDSNYKRKKKQKQEKPRRDNLLKSTAEPYFTNPDQIAEGMEFENDKSFIYAYVEKENLRSWNFSESVDFVTVGNIHSSLISRFRPKQNPNIRTIESNEKEFVLEKLRDFYKEYTMFTEQNLFFNNNYLVWEENGQIIAGCQANPELWNILHIPGFLSSVFLKVITRLPFISKRFNPKYLKFVAFEGLWYEKEYGSRLIEMIESALAHHKMYLGVLWLDSDSHVHKQITELGKKGMVSRFFNAIPGDIRVRFVNFEEKDIEEFYKKPGYISCFDMT